MHLFYTLSLAFIATNCVSSFSPIPSLRRSTVGTVYEVFTSKPLALSNQDKEDALDAFDGNSNLATTKKSTDPKSGVEHFTTKFFNHAKAKQAAMMAVLMLGLAPLPSNAAMSGGRIGGSFSSPRSSTSSRSSYGGGYSRGSGSGFASGYATGLGAGYMSSPRIGYSPFVSPFYSRPYYGGAGIITYNPGPSLGQLVFFGGVALAISSALNRETVDWNLPTATDIEGTASVLGPGTSFAKVSVALEVPNRDDPSSILSVLNRLGQNSNAESKKGIQSLTSQVALELLRRKSSIVSATSEYKHFRSRSQALREFNNQATNERSKFERENTRLHQVSQSGPIATMAVVTLVLAIDGDSTKIPLVRNIGDIEEALRSIASDSKMDDCLQSVEILWTPEERTETLTRKDVLADYPTLTSV